MKNIRYILMTFIAAFCVTSCEWFELDNMDGHDATIAGKFVDADGDLVPSEVYSSQTGVFNVIELGWDSEKTQTWYIKNNGTYRNNLVWAGKYRMQTTDSNYYPFNEEFELKKGDNTVDFTVQPFAKVIDPVFTYDAATQKIKATCKVKVTDPSKTSLKEVRLCCYTDCFVGTSFNNCKNDAGAVVKDVALTNGEANVTVEIDTQASANAVEFKYERVHYVRVAALAAGTGVNNSSRSNFSQTYSIALDGTPAVEYTKW